MREKRDVDFYCSKCGKLLFAMEYSHRVEVTDGTNLIVHPDISFMPKEEEIDFMAVNNTVKFSPCSHCQSLHRNATAEAVAEEIETPIEETLKELAKEIQKELDKAQELDERLGDTLNEIYNSIKALEQSGTGLRDLAKRVKEILKEKTESIMSDLETFKQ